mmetsp:Transcript_10127/g.13261  ORF Transcript_10127/g.13261 Transcript_10127/m.13261 type:complete len:91 (+) Transcript_10127:1064-1336(+)
MPNSCQSSQDEKDPMRTKEEFPELPTNRPPCQNSQECHCYFTYGPNTLWMKPCVYCMYCTKDNRGPCAILVPKYRSIKWKAEEYGPNRIS